MILTEPRTPPAEYRPEIDLRKPHKAPRRFNFDCADLADAIYVDFMRRWPAHDVWAFRYWKTGHNVHVEHWHGVSRPGSAR